MLNISIFVLTTVYVLQKNIKNITEIWIKTYFCEIFVNCDSSQQITLLVFRHIVAETKKTFLKSSQKNTKRLFS